MRYGYFDKKEREYVITRPDTPTPWINYIGMGRYGGIVSNTGGGYSFDRDPQNRRITRYRYNNIPMDRPGRYIYIRDAVSGEYWNPGWQPVQRQLDSYCCRHGLGYTVLQSENKGVSSEVTYFVPDDKNFEVWLVKLKNLTGTPRNLQVFSYAEFCFWDAIRDQQNIDWCQQINQCRYEDQIIVYYPHEFEQSMEGAFVASGEEVASYDASLEAFIGKYRSESNPIAVEMGACSNSMSYRMNGVGAFCVNVELQKNEEREMVFILGSAQDRSKIREEIRPYLRPEFARDSLRRLKKYWSSYLDKLYVETPDEDMNLFVNLWNQYQCKVTFNWSRFVSLYQTGLGRGMGFRDSAQDIMGVMHAIPDEAKGLIINILKCQYTDGRAYHLYFPLTGSGGEGDAPIKKFDWYSDDHLWIIMSVDDYIKETGDFNFLDMEIPYNDKQTVGTVWEHMCRAIEFTGANLGPNRLALAGRADWNDTLNLDMGNGIAESVFTSMLYCNVLNTMIELCSYLGRGEDSIKYTGLFNDMKEAINASCWDGEWYKRAFDDMGMPLGSKTCEYGKIYINSQSWAVLGRVATEEYAKKCLESVDKYLNSEYGIATVYPAYRQFDESKGGITTYPPGAKENGGIFLHTNPWVMIANIMIGKGDRAFKYYKQILPATRNDAAELLEVEPYVYPQNILGKEHPQFGTGRNSWLSGTAAWNMLASSRYILGIRQGYDCLTVDPCIPSEWDGFKAKRVFRGAVYNIEVKNPDKVSKGVHKLIVDGSETDKIPVFDKGTTHSVEVIMG